MKKNKNVFLFHWLIIEGYIFVVQKHSTIVHKFD